MSSVDSHIALDSSLPSRERTPALAFAALLAFVLLTVLRPFDLVPALGNFHIVKLTFALSFLAWFLSQRPLAILSHQTNKFAIALLVMMILTIPFSYWPTQSLSTSILYMKQLAVFLLMVNIVTSMKLMVPFLWVLVLSIGVHAGIVIYAYLTNQLYLGRAFSIVGGSFNDPNDLALSFVMMLPIAAWLIGRNHRWLRWLLGSILLLFLGGLLAVQSRGGMFGLVAVVGLMIKNSRRKAAATAIILFLGGIVFLSAPRRVFDRFFPMTEYSSEASAVARMRTLKTGLRMWGDHPVIGVGAGSFYVAYGQKYLAPGENKWNAAHCSPLAVAVELGTVGLAIWIGMVIGGFRALREARRLLRPYIHESYEANQLYLLCAALAVSLVGFLVCAMFLTRHYDWMLMFLLALCVSCWLIAHAAVEGGELNQERL